MSLCEDILPLLSCRASGPLDDEDEALVAAHLEQCAACRARLERDEALLAELSLPPASRELAAALERLPERTAREWRKGERSRRRFLKVVGVSAAAAALLAGVLGPAWLRDRAFTHSPSPSAELAAAAPAQGAPPVQPAVARQAQPATARAAQPAVAVQTASWEGPDLDEAWEASAVVGGDSVAEVAMADEGSIFDSASP